MESYRSMNIKSVSLFSIAVLLVLGLVPSVFYSQLASARENEIRSEVETTVERTVENEVELTESIDRAQEPIEVRRAEAEKKARERRAEADAKVAQIKAERESLKEDRKTVRLDANKLKVCQRQETKVTDVMNRASDQGTRQLEVFKKIADRTQEFASNKNLTVENYAALVIDVEAKYDVALEALNTISTSSTGFSCEADDPKFFLSSFRSAHQQKTEAMKAYKTAIKDLIVAVKSSQSTAKNTASAETRSTTDVEAR